VSAANGSLRAGIVEVIQGMKPGQFPSPVTETVTGPWNPVGCTPADTMTAFCGWSVRSWKLKGSG
jgi:hypothetical protein